MLKTAAFEFGDSNRRRLRNAADSTKFVDSSRRPIALVRGMAFHCHLEFSRSAAQTDENLTKSNDGGVSCLGTVESISGDNRFNFLLNPHTLPRRLRTH